MNMKMMTMKQEDSTGGGGSDASAMTDWGRHLCHTCGGCRATYICSACDENERVVPICDACELGPEVFYYKADAASLYQSCNAHIHGVNHPAAAEEEEGNIQNGGYEYDHDDDDEAASWLLPNPHDDDDIADGKVNMNEAALDTFEYMSTTEEGYGCGCGSDEGVVPFQLPFERYHNFNVTSLFDDDDDFFYVDDSSSSPKPATSTNYNYHAVNYMEVGVVPDDESTEKGRRMEALTTTAAATKLKGMEREARVMRYREKKKRRKFEKTIRYASRKAYAETRPRIKGRFAKRPKKHNMVDHHHNLFSSTISSHQTSYY
ncbi:Zinc finger protein CONSTANS-LIKE 2 [Linum grandiflorum]